MINPRVYEAVVDVLSELRSFMVERPYEVYMRNRWRLIPIPRYKVTKVIPTLPSVSKSVSDKTVNDAAIESVIVKSKIDSECASKSTVSVQEVSAYDQQPSTTNPVRNTRKSV